jgi:hypothetical protein
MCNEDNKQMDKIKKDNEKKGNLKLTIIKTSTKPQFNVI